MPSGPRAAWLDQELGAAGGRTCVIALHHPSVPRGVPRADDFLLADRDEFGAVVARHDVAAILCGHSHVWRFGFRNFDVGFSSAAAVLFFVAFGALALLCVRVIDRFSFYDA